jgi:outer membrane biosynthesis protein TonB
LITDDKLTLLGTLMTNAATMRLLKAGAAMGPFVWLSHAQKSPAKPKVPTLSIGIELRSDAGQADLKPFVSHLYKAVKQKALETMPKSASQGDQAVVCIQLQVQRDGTITSPGVPRLVFGSAKESFDHNAINAVSKAAPFDRVPDSADGPVVLRLTFYYNVAPPSLQ